MSVQTLQITSAITPTQPMAPHWAEIDEIQIEAPGVSTYWLRFTNPALREGYTFSPGQFNILTMPGYGESAISISSSPENTERIGHTVRFVGNVTNAISRLKVGDQVGVRGPFGTSWPMEFAKGQDIFVTAYNDDTDDGKIIYTATDRVVFPGASMLG